MLNADQIEAKLTEFTRALPKQGEPLDYSDPKQRKLYVDSLHGNRIPTMRLFKEMTREIGDSVYLFSGQTGSGKSTELLRLRSLLNDRSNKDFKAYYVDLEDWLSMTEPIGLGTLLVAILAGWIDAIGTQGMVAQSLTTRLQNLFTSAAFIPQTLTLGSGFGSIKGVLQNNANVRADVESKLRDGTKQFIEQVHGLTLEIRNALCGSEQECVLILDSLEKNTGYDANQKEVYESLVQIFVKKSNALRLLGLKTIYSVPPALVEQHPEMVAAFGHGNLVFMPAVHVLQDRTVQHDDEGIQGMLAMLQERYPAWREVFTDTQMRRLVVGTGGDLRDFYRSIRIALTEDVSSLPLPDQAIDYALNRICPPTVLLRKEVEWMAEVVRSHNACLNEDVPPFRLQHFLTTKHVLIYMNGRAWYAVHPLLRDWILQQAPLAASTSTPASTALAG